MKKLNPKTKLILFTIILIGLIGSILLSVIVVANSNKDNNSNLNIEPTTTPTPTAQIVDTTPTLQVTPTVTPIKPVSTPKPTSPASEIKLKCTDCTLAPVDKTYALPSTYVPSVVASGLSGGGNVTSTTKTQLSKLFADAKTKGITITIVSSYRSYATQKSTFESWVQKEMAKGYSRSEAEKRANTYSARPGHSEHQLGTTVDLRCSTCAAFDNSSGNLKLYKYLEDNAHKFGFVVSYPPNSESTTGYVHEGWHIRYIGVTMATELYNQNYITSNGVVYLAKYLREKWNF